LRRTNKNFESDRDASCIPTEQRKNMKTNLQKDFLSDNGFGRAFPLTDCQYHSATMPRFNGGCARRELLSFRNISGAYFRDEAPGEFRTEMIAFSAIIVTAAVPIISSMHALVNLLRSIGTL
jgi:hypothetical protein